MKRIPLILTFFSALLFAPFSLANQTIEPWASCDGLGWEPIGAVTVNVHRDNGDYLESVNGSSGFWIAPGTGSYFLVVADGNDWRDWTRSNTVFYERGPDTEGGCVDPNLFTENTRFNVLSETEIEFTWNLDPRFVNRYAHVEIFRTNDDTGDSETIMAMGTRYYADDLSPDNSYTFALVTFDIYGWSGDSVQIFDGVNTRELLDEGNAQKPLAPLALRVEVYSSTALELFWENNTDFVHGESTYSVLLDNVPLTTGLDGSSLFIDELSSGTPYEFNVTTTKPNSMPSEPASVSAITFGVRQNDDLTDNITVDASGTIRWKEPGWYQVQNAMTFKSLCEGESSCTVPPGMYIVINHHTGVREAVIVN